jgi:Stigma-specific protein, Stig1
MTLSRFAASASSFVLLWGCGGAVFDRDSAADAGSSGREDAASSLGPTDAAPRDQNDAQVGPMLDAAHASDATTTVDAPSSADAQGDAAACAAPQIACGTKCVDPQADPSNCGWCGHDCLGASCTEGLCTPTTLYTTTTRQDFAGLAVSPTTLYWGQLDGPAIMAMPVDGGAAVTLTFYGAGPGRIVLDATHVYWSNPGGDIVGMPMDGGQVTLIASSSYAIGPLAIDAHDAFWIASNLSIESAPLDGGVTTTIAPPQSDPTDIAVAGGRVIWGNGNTSGTAGALLETGLDGGPSQVFASLNGVPETLVVDAHNVYWAGGQSILAEPLSGGTITAVGAGAAAHMAVDANRVYWADDFTIHAAPLDGGGPSVELCDTTNVVWIQDIAVDDRYVYWLGLDAVMRVPK